MGKEKKEIGKLIELLNEYDGKNHWWDYDEEYLTSEEFYGENGDLEIISKKFGFIKWLVENDKIDREKVKEKSDRIPLLLDKVGDIYNCGVLKSVLMLLSISDTPIEDLILYLK